MKVNIEVRTLEIIDLHEDALQHFDRYQVTERVRYRERDNDLYKDDRFIDRWSDEDKKEVTEMLLKCLDSAGIAAGAFDGNKLIGFASVENERFGRNNEYAELSLMHVSNGYRDRGIGRRLFELCCRAAKSKGMEKLYIAAHPAVETQQFYTNLGCVPATEINRAIYEKEPRDIQLEITL